jgi:hypothetical protein
VIILDVLHVMKMKGIISLEALAVIRIVSSTRTKKMIDAILAPT